MRYHWIWLSVLSILAVMPLGSCHAHGTSPSAFNPRSYDHTFGHSSREDSTTCHDVHSTPKSQQCAFVQQHCGSEQVSRVSYLSVYYCHFTSHRWLSLVPIVSALFLCFVSLGTTAGDFLCPNLYTVSRFLKLSDNVAGLTLLALGNGAPDVLSTFKAMQVDAGDLAVSELMGASLFITTVVLGSMAIVKPFTVPGEQFVRDVSFYLAVTVIILLAILMRGLHLVSCILLVSTYIIYVIVVIWNHATQKMEAKKKLQYFRSRNNFTPSGQHRDVANDIDDVYLDNLASLPSIDALDHDVEITPSGPYPRSSSPSTEFNKFLHDHDTTAENVPLETGSYGLKILLKELSKHTSHRRAGLNTGSIFLDDNHQRPLTAPAGTTHFRHNEEGEEEEGFGAHQAPHSHPKPYRDAIYADDTSPTAPQQTHSAGDQAISFSADPHQLRSPYIVKLMRLWQLVQPDVVDIKDANMANKVYYILSFPISVMLKTSTPVRDQYMIGVLEQSLKFSHLDDADQGDDEYDFKSDKLLLQVQLFFAINFINYSVLNSDSSTFRRWYFPLGLALSIILGPVALHYLYRHPSSSSLGVASFRLINSITSIVGFITAICWIATFATEIIGILKALSVIWNLSDAILGITVFALGNSVGDLISNLTISGMGMPIMAFGACFGGPLLSLCSLGLIGIVLTASSSTISTIAIGSSKTLVTTSLALVLNVMMILAVVPRNNWQLDRKLGVVLITNWIISTTVCIILELI